MSTHDLSSDEDDSMLEDHPHHRGLFGGPGAISDDDELTDGTFFVTTCYLKEFTSHYALIKRVATCVSHFH